MLITGNLFIPNTYILGWAQRSYVQLLPRYVLSHKILQRCAPVVSKNVVKARYQLEILYYCIHVLNGPSPASFSYIFIFSNNFYNK